MRGKELYEKLTDIDSNLLEETGKMKGSQKPVFIKWIAAVACFAIVVSLVSFLNGNKSTTDPSLPMLALDTDFAGGMGFEGYMAYDISDLTNANPWNQGMRSSHLPVIKNKVTYNEMQQVEEPDHQLMKDLLKETAQDLGMDVENELITDVSRFFLEDEHFVVEVDTSYTVKVEFKQPVMLPSGYNFTYQATYDDLFKVATYLKDTYSDFIALNNPIINISGGDYTFDVEQSYRIAFYEESEDPVQSILNYHFNTVKFYCNDEGALFLARKYYTDLSQVVGHYPIINEKEALTLLENNNYMTSVPEAFEDKKFVRRVELVYRAGNMEKLFMPYYRFYVELPSMKLDNGLKTYGAYYVPAVEGQYIENMPVWDGSFN